MAGARQGRGAWRVLSFSLSLSACLPSDRLGWTFNFKSLVMAARGGNLTPQPDSLSDLCEEILY